MPDIILHPIGLVRSPFTEPAGMPIQPCGAQDTPGQVVVDQAYAPALADLEGFSHIFLLYHFHKSQGYDLAVTPFMDTTPRGLFSTRAPRRPNQIGLSVVRLERIQDNVVHILGVDVLDGTPLLDIKPYMRAFDAFPRAWSGWAEKEQDNAHGRRSDARFAGRDPRPGP